MYKNYSEYERNRRIGIVKKALAYYHQLSQDEQKPVKWICRMVSLKYKISERTVYNWRDKQWGNKNESVKATTTEVL